MDETIEAIIHWTTRAVELAGIAVIIFGAIWATVGLARRRGEGDAVKAFRSSLGRSVLVGLEFLVAADIISTVAIEPTLESVAVLGAIVLIRTFLSWSLEVEIEGKWPWQGRGT